MTVKNYLSSALSVICQLKNTTPARCSHINYYFHLFRTAAPRQGSVTSGDGGTGISAPRAQPGVRSRKISCKPHQAPRPPEGRSHTTPLQPRPRKSKSQHAVIHTSQLAVKCKVPRRPILISRPLDLQKVP
jgi:hypothetical protein